MQTITIKNFGPIVEVIDLPINDFMVFIGPQASGKSTIAKAIYFFKWLREDIFKQIASDKSLEYSLKINYCIRIIKKAFFTYFTGYDLQDGKLEYKFSSKFWIIIQINKNQIAEIELSNELEGAIQDIRRKLIDFKNKSELIEKQRGESSINYSILRQDIGSQVDEILNNIFGKTQSNSYTPASRSFLSYIRPNNNDLDIPSFTYLETVSNAKVRFSRGIEHYLDLAGWYPPAMISLAKKLIGNVLGGDYRYDSADNTEKIVLKRGQKINLKLASSGQQEAIWIMLLTLEKLVSKSVGFSAVEEPEAHLYPEAQRDIVQLIALLANQNSNQVLITTHSPYILSAINNLMYAYQMGQTKPTETGSLIPSSLWLKPSDVSAYFVNNGTIKSIIDDELKLIKVESIDSASAIINEEYDKLFELEIK